MAARRALCLLPLVAVAVALPVPPAHAAPGWGWPLPAPHQVVRGFAPPLHDWLPGHRGVDLAGRAGEPVATAGAGRVAFAGAIGGVPVVAVRHPGGLETTYEPVHAAVHVGAPVSTGTFLGVLLAHGGHCLPAACLHWGLRRAGAYLDPLGLVATARVRLLPMLGRASGAAWLAPAVSGASLGSSTVVLGWAFAVRRRRRRPLPDGVASLAHARQRRAEPPPDLDARA